MTTASGQTVSRNRIAEIKATFAPYRFRPATGKVWLDAVYLLILVALQFSVLASFGRSVLVFDLVTPWLVVTFVHEREWVVLLMSILAGVALETHSAAPAGCYVSAYLVVAAVLLLARNALSWRHFVSWLFTFIAVQAWIVIFETFVIAVTRNTDVLDFTYFAVQAGRTIISVAFGISLCLPHLALIRQQEAEDGDGR